MADVLAGKQQVVCVGWMDGPLWITLDNGFIFMQRVLYYTHTLWMQHSLNRSRSSMVSRCQVAVKLLPQDTTDFRREIWFVAKIILVVKIWVSDSSYLVIWIDLCNKYRHRVPNFSSPVAIMTWDAFSVGAPVMSGSRLLRVTHRENGVAK